jgi:alanyl-tRNA synthetase
LEEEGLTLAEDDFFAEMQKQRERARAAREEQNYMGAEETAYHKLDVNLKTEFAGYGATEILDAQIIAIISNAGPVSQAEANEQEISILLDRTPFYAESGGQKGDTGFIKTPSGVYEVADTIKVIGGRTAHIGKVINGSIKTGDIAAAQIDTKRRNDIRRNHTATHLLQKALREVLGNHVQQAGSMVSNRNLRFDFTHFSPVTQEELKHIESVINDKILEELPVTVEEMSIDEARRLGAMALFGEKYGSTVRVVKIGDYSIELCGGTHLYNTVQAGAFKILSESGIAAGIRRIEAITGRETIKYFNKAENTLQELAELLKSSRDLLVQRVQNLISEGKTLRQEIENINAKKAMDVAEEILSAKETISDIDIVVGQIQDLDINALRGLCDKLRDKLQNGLIVLCNKADGKVTFLISADELAVSKGIHAGTLVKAAASICCGGGGGKPGMAQAGGKDPSKADDALAAVKEMIKNQLM